MHYDFIGLDNLQAKSDNWLSLSNRKIKNGRLILNSGTSNGRRGARPLKIIPETKENPLLTCICQCLCSDLSIKKKMVSVHKKLQEYCINIKVR